jgi:hypothetical protein
MKTSHFLVLVLSLALTVACGDKDKKKSNNLPVWNQLQGGQMPQPRTEEGLFNLQSGAIEVDGRTYSVQQISQQSLQYLQQLGMQLQQNPYQYRPAYQANNVLKYRVRITGYLTLGGYGQYPQMPGQYPQQTTANQYTLVITAPLVPHN